MADTCPCPKFFAGDYGDGVVSQPEWPDYEIAADNMTDDLSVWAEYSEAAHDALRPCFVDGFTSQITRSFEGHMFQKVADAHQM